MVGSTDTIGSVVVHTLFVGLDENATEPVWVYTEGISLAIAISDTAVTQNPLKDPLFYHVWEKRRDTHTTQTDQAAGAVRSFGER